MKDHEHKEAKALIKWRNLQLGKYPELKSLIHIPNGGMRNLRVAQKLKAEGTKPGVSDYLLPVARRIVGKATMTHLFEMGHTFHEYGPVYPLYHGLWVELKANCNKPNLEQHEWLNDMRDQGYAAFWCDGWYEATEIIAAYLEAKEIPGRDPKARGTYVLKKDRPKAPQCYPMLPDRY